MWLFAAERICRLVKIFKKHLTMFQQQRGCLELCVTDTNVLSFLSARVLSQSGYAVKFTATLKLFMCAIDL